MSSVLVIDDEPGQREVLRLLLEDAGYHVEEAASAGSYCIGKMVADGEE